MKYKLTCVVLFAAGLSSAQLVHHSIEGMSSSGLLGTAVDSAGDVNADGIADFIVGSGFDSSIGAGYGRADVFSGADGSVLYTMYGDGADQLFGYSAAGVGDLNADNHADFMVGTLRQGLGPPGYVKVFSGIDGSVLYLLTGAAPADQFGCSVAAAGDVDADGIGDLVVGAQWEQSSSGSATVFSGATGQVLYKRFGIGTNDFFGGSVSGCGDVDGDGFGDVIVGGREPQLPLSTGYVRVFSGPMGTLKYTINGPVLGARFGSGVHGGPDLNGDGYSDFIVGAPFSDLPLTGCGGAGVFSGLNGSSLFGFAGVVPFDHIATVVRLVPDLNGDAVPDILINAQLFANGGQVRVRSGADGSMLRVLDEAVYGDNFGSSASSLPDINGDGFPEIIAGATLHDSTTAVDCGKVVVLSIAGARRYGIAPTQEMHLKWIPHPTLGVGDLNVAFASPGPGLLLASGGPGSTVIGNQVVLVDILSPEFLQLPVAFNSAGSLNVQIDLNQPSLDGEAFFLQAAELTPSFFIVSNGLQLLFCR